MFHKTRVSVATMDALRRKSVKCTTDVPSDAGSDSSRSWNIRWVDDAGEWQDQSLSFQAHLLVALDTLAPDDHNSLDIAIH